MTIPGSINDGVSSVASEGMTTASPTTDQRNNTDMILQCLPPTCQELVCAAKQFPGCLETTFDSQHPGTSPHRDGQQEQALVQMYFFFAGEGEVFALLFRLNVSPLQLQNAS